MILYKILQKHDSHNPLSNTSKKGRHFEGFFFLKIKYEIKDSFVSACGLYDLEQTKKLFLNLQTLISLLERG